MPKERRPKADCKADTRGGAWLGLPKAVFESEAFRTLTPMERAVLFEILGRMNGYNNGKIAISYAELAHRLNRRNQAKFAAAISTLIEHGLIAPGEDYVWKERKAREYRLTFVNTVENGRFVAATNEYRKWRPGEKNRLTDAVARKQASVTAFVADRKKPAINAVAARHGKLPRRGSQAATDGVILIGNPYPLGKKGACLTRSAALRKWRSKSKCETALALIGSMGLDHRASRRTLGQ